MHVTYLKIVFPIESDDVEFSPELKQDNVGNN